jgi:hypothetical protein
LCCLSLTPSALTNSRRTSDRQRCVSGILTMCEINVPGSDGHLSRGENQFSRTFEPPRAAPGMASSLVSPRRGNSDIKGAARRRIGNCRPDDQSIANTAVNRRAAICTHPRNRPLAVYTASDTALRKLHEEKRTFVYLPRTRTTSPLAAGITMPCSR